MIPDASKSSLGAFVKATTAQGALVHTDGWKGYNGLRAAGYEHRPRSQGAAEPGEQLLPRAHRAVSNLKRGCTGPIGASPTSTCRSTSMSSSSGTTAAAPRWPPFRRCSGSAPFTRPPPMTSSPVGIRRQPELTGYAQRP